MALTGPDGTNPVWVPGWLPWQPGNRAEHHLPRGCLPNPTPSGSASGAVGPGMEAQPSSSREACGARVSVATGAGADVSVQALVLPPAPGRCGRMSQRSSVRPDSPSPAPARLPGGSGAASRSSLLNEWVGSRVHPASRQAPPHPVLPACSLGLQDPSLKPVLEKRVASPGGWLSWLECCPAHQKAVSSIPAWQGGTYRRQPIGVSLWHPCPPPVSLLLFLK